VPIRSYRRVETYLADLDVADRLSRRPINDSLSFLRQILGRAVRDGAIYTNPCREAPTATVQVGISYLGQRYDQVEAEPLEPLPFELGIVECEERLYAGRGHETAGYAGWRGPEILPGYTA
jgi:hypothetical protein